MKAPTSLIASLLMVGTLNGSNAQAAESVKSVMQDAVQETMTDEQYVIDRIQFIGNKTTLDKVMLRELPFQSGQLVSAAQIEKGRQAILNLGLFKSVGAERKEINGAQVLSYIVSEKIYLLPLPRVDANTDGQYAYGAQVRWNNVAGLNHTLRATVLKRQAQTNGVGQETQFSTNYNAPYFLDSAWNVNGGLGLSMRAVDGSLGVYDENFANVGLMASRFINPQLGSQGWSIGAGLLWERQDTSGQYAPNPYGMATAPVFSLGYKDLRYKVYSEEGTVFGLRAATAFKNIASDYSYAMLNGGYKKTVPLGETAHQTLSYGADAGLRWEGPKGVNAFEIGGASSMHGYANGAREGDGYYHFNIEVARPIFKPWLRVMAQAEVGDAFAQPTQLLHSSPLTSIGLGLKMRLPMLVDFEVEAGIALPLNGGGARFFGGKGITR